jgi:two-component system OmpR family sensor kinase
MPTRQAAIGTSWRQRLFGSLLGQLRLAAFASVFVGFTTASAATLLINHQALFRQHERRLEDVGSILQRQLPLLARDPSPARRRAAAAALDRTSSGQLLFWIRLADGSLLLPLHLREPPLHLLAARALEAQIKAGELRTLSSAGFPQRTATLGPVPRDRYRVVAVGEREFLTHQHRIGSDGSGLWVAEDISANLEFLSSLLGWIVLAWSICLLLTLLAISWLTRRIIRPLRDLNSLASAVTSSSLACSRLEVTRAPLEVQDLAAGYNNLLDSLSLVWQQQREFVSTVSHELRNPLTIIAGYLQRLQRRGTNLDPDQRRNLATVEAETHRISRLLNDLLDLSRSDSGRLQLVLRPVSVDAVLLTACDLARSQLRRPLHLELPPQAEQQPILALAEEDRLQQVLLNLIENADKYSPSGSPILVRLEPEPGPGGGLSIRVIDQGIGIAAEDLPLIFDRFHRGRNAALERRGSGLGLSVVKLLVEAMGGSIDVESQLNQGSCFHLHLPAYPCPSVC